MCPLKVLYYLQISRFNEHVGVNLACENKFSNDIMMIKQNLIRGVKIQPKNRDTALFINVKMWPKIDL